MLNEIEKAYIAGFFDGEGSVVISPSKRKRTETEPCEYTDYYLIVAMSNTNKEIIDFIMSKFGNNGSRYSGIPYEGCKRIYRLTLNATFGKEFIHEIYPYLRVKKKQAEIALRFPVQKTHTRGRPLDKDTLLIRKLLEAELKVLNKRGTSVQSSSWSKRWSARSQLIKMTPEQLMTAKKMIVAA